MLTRAWVRGLSAGTLMIAGLATSSPFVASAQQTATPPAGQSASQSADDGENQGPPIVGTPLLQPAIDLTRAQEIALEGQANAVVTGIDLNGDDGVLEYSVTPVESSKNDDNDDEDNGDSHEESDNGDENNDDQGDSHESGDDED